MNRFAAGIRVVLITIGLCVSGVAFAETQCVGGAPPPCEPIPVTDSRDPLPDCAQSGTCASNDPITLADGSASQRAPRDTNGEGFRQLFKTFANLCKKSSESCSEWQLRIAGLGGYCKQQSAALVSVCTIAVDDQAERNCPDVACPAG